MKTTSPDILKHTIASRGVSWPQFAARCGISYGELLGWLTLTYLPGKETVRKVAEAVPIGQTDLLAQVEEDRQAVLAWATDILSDAGLTDVTTLRQIAGGRNSLFRVCSTSGTRSWGSLLGISCTRTAHSSIGRRTTSPRSAKATRRRFLFPLSILIG